MRKNHKKLKPIFILFLCLLSMMLTGSAQAASTISVTDFQGREVSVKAPVERVVLLESSKTPEIAAIIGDGFEKCIVGWDDDFEKNAGDIYARFVEKFPGLKNIPDVGSMYEGTMSIEKVIELNPDVVIAQQWMFIFGGDATKTALARLEQAGVPVVFLDFWADPLNNSTKSMILLGRLLGREERAKEIVDFYEAKVAQVRDRLKTAKSPNPTTYVECAYLGPSVYALSYGDVAWGLIIKDAGGDNIGTPVLKDTAKALSPEYLIAQSPETVVLTGRYWKGDDTLRMGYLSSPDTVKATMKPFVERAGWDTLNAVRNHKVYGIYHGFCFSIFNFSALEILAKWYHPEVFEDVDPVETLKDFHQKFMPIEYSGTFLFNYVD